MVSQYPRGAESQSRVRPTSADHSRQPAYRPQPTDCQPAPTGSRRHAVRRRGTASGRAGSPKRQRYLRERNKVGAGLFHAPYASLQCRLPCAAVPPIGAASHQPNHFRPQQPSNHADRPPRKRAQADPVAGVRPKQSGRRSVWCYRRDDVCQYRLRPRQRQRVISLPSVPTVPRRRYQNQPSRTRPTGFLPGIRAVYVRHRHMGLWYLATHTLCQPQKCGGEIRERQATHTCRKILNGRCRCLYVLLCLQLRPTQPPLQSGADYGRERTVHVAVHGYAYRRYQEQSRKGSRGLWYRAVRRKSGTSRRQDRCQIYSQDGIQRGRCSPARQPRRSRRTDRYLWCPQDSRGRNQPYDGRHRTRIRRERQNRVRRQVEPTRHSRSHLQCYR